MTNSIAQISVAVKTFTIAQLSAMPTAVNGEQFPINTKSVDRLVDVLQPEAAILYIPIAVASLNGLEINVNGRHRTAALEVLYDGDASVTCVYHECDTAEQIAELTVHYNGSRRCTKSEAKAVTSAAKYGFGSYDVASLTSLLYHGYLSPNAQLSTLQSILGMTVQENLALNDEFLPTLTVDGAEAVAKALLTQLKKASRSVETQVRVPESTNKAGHVTGGGVITKKVRETLLSVLLSDETLLDDLINAVIDGCTQACGPDGVRLSLPLRNAIATHKYASVIVTTAELCDVETDPHYIATVDLTGNIGHVAASYAACVAPTIISRFW